MHHTSVEEIPVLLRAELGPEVLDINGLGIVDYFNRPGVHMGKGYCPSLVPTKPNYL